ncbi:MAG TPA: phage holin family protein [Planctomycetota bacterium]|nr:phage holin family protein [Planctomycetota bacterium]
MTQLHKLDLAWKLLITMFLIVLSSGFAVAELYLLHTTEMVDGEKGMSLDDITLQFYGSPVPTMITKVNGTMKKYFAETGEEKDLTDEDKADIQKVVEWVEKGAKEEEYEFTDPEENKKKSGPIGKIFNNHGCYDCHSAEATMKGNKKDAPLDTWAGVSKYIKPNTGMDKGRLLALSHIHLLGMGMMFLLAGAAVALSAWPKGIKCALIVGGLGSILLDIFGWWGVKWFGAPLAPVVMAGGILMAVSFGGSVFVALYDLWLRRDKKSEGAVLKDVPAAAAAHGE